MPEKTAPEYVPMADAVRDFAKELDAQTENDFFPTGFPSHDNALGRLRRGYVTFIGARPSMGKTAFMFAWRSHR
jgi:replicative DNA helicase